MGRLGTARIERKSRRAISSTFDAWKAPFKVFAAKGGPFEIEVYGSIDTSVDKFADKQWHFVDLWSEKGPDSVMGKTLRIKLVPFRFIKLVPVLSLAWWRRIFRRKLNNPTIHFGATELDEIDHRWAHAGYRLRKQNYDKFCKLLASLDPDAD